MRIILKSTSKGKENWSGKEFSSNLAKVYTSHESVLNALNSYAFYEFNKIKCEYEEIDENDIVPEIRIIHLTEKRFNALLEAGKIRL